MQNDDRHDDLVLSEAQFREVIERATRADLRDDGVSVKVLRQVAEELDIDPKALQRALADVVGVANTDRPVRGWLQRQITNAGRVFDFFLPKRGRLAAGVVVGTFFGWMTAHVALGLRIVVDGHSVSVGSSSFVDVPVFFLFMVLTLANSLSRRLDGHFNRYLGEIAAMWLAFGVSWSLTFGRATDDLMTLTLCSIAGAAAWGWLVIRRTPSRQLPAMTPVVEATKSVAVVDAERINPLEQRAHTSLIALIVLGFSVPRARRASLAI